MVALIAKPEKPIFEASTLANTLHNQTYTSLVSNRTVRHPCWNRHHIAWTEVYGFCLTVDLRLDGDVPFKLVEELLCLVVMVIFSSVRSCNDHHNVVVTFRSKILVCYRRFKFVAILFQPFLEVEGLQCWHVYVVFGCCQDTELSR